MKVIRSRDVTLNEDVLYNNDLATTPSKIRQHQKVVFEESTDVDVLQPKIDKGSQNSRSAEETMNTEVSGSFEKDKD